MELDDPLLIETESHEAYRDGFVGKLAIHPKTIEAINTSFTPDETQLLWAHKVLSAFEEKPSSGAFALDGKMIDRPHLRLAQRLLREF